MDNAEFEQAKTRHGAEIEREGEMKRMMTVKMQDGSVWGVPVMMIANSRAAHYMDEFGGSLERSLAEDTIPLFEADTYQIQDWAVGNMNWEDFDGHQMKIRNADPPDYNEAWLNGEKGFE